MRPRSRIKRGPGWDPWDEAFHRDNLAAKKFRALLPIGVVSIDEDSIVGAGWYHGERGGAEFGQNIPLMPSKLSDDGLRWLARTLMMDISKTLPNTKHWAKA